MFLKDAFSESGFSWQRSLNCALACHVAYEAEATVQITATGWGFDGCQAFSASRTQGFVAWDSHVILVAFRGTKELGDWLTNLDVVRTSDPPTYGRVHRGFFEGYVHAKEILLEILNQADVANKSVWITGHSLGGALATMMAGDMQEQFRMEGIYTFGQPRVVDRRSQAHFRTHLHEQFFRFVNDSDVVPMVPPLLKHVGEILWFGGDGSLKRAPDGVRSDDFGPEEMTEEEFEAEKVRIESVLRQVNEAHEKAASMSLEDVEKMEMDGESVRGILPSVRDHFMPRYIRRIVAKVNSEA